MKVLVIGVGIVGTLYGWALAEGGHEVVHLVRPHRPEGVEELSLDLWDERKGRRRRRAPVYRRRSVIGAPEGSWDLVVAAVKGRQLAGVLEDWAKVLAPTPFLLMTSTWAGPGAATVALGADRALFSDSQAGGRWEGSTLVAALGSDLPVDRGLAPERRALLEAVFGPAGIRLEAQADIHRWNWVQHASNGGLWPALVEAGSFRALFQNQELFRRGLAATREALEVCTRRGVDLRDHPEASFYLAKPGLQTRLLRQLMKFQVLHRESVRRVSAHALDDPAEILETYRDLRDEGRRLGVPMPTFEAFGPVVEAFANRATLG